MADLTNIVDKGATVLELFERKTKPKAKLHTAGDGLIRKRKGILVSPLQSAFVADMTEKQRQTKHRKKCVIVVTREVAKRRVKGRDTWATVIMSSWHLGLIE
jgi:hypothetical protein